MIAGVIISLRHCDIVVQRDATDKHRFTVSYRHSWELIHASWVTDETTLHDFTARTMLALQRQVFPVKEFHDAVRFLMNAA